MRFDRLFPPVRLGAACVVVATVYCTVPAEAALSPFYQRLAELNAILADPAITGALEPHGPIDAVEAAGPDRYVVRAGGCVLGVAVATVPPPAGEAPMPGPRKFKLTAGAVACP